MPNHSENTARIVAYLSYLRDISRKLISRAGFEKCLQNNAVQFIDLPLVLKPDGAFYNEMHSYNNYLQKNHDKKLFLGFGTILGKTTRIFAAPLILVQCDINKDDVSHIITIEPDIGSLSLNYDFISAITTNKFNEEEEVLNPLSEEQNRTIEEIEERLKKFNYYESAGIIKATDEIYIELNKKIDSFKNIMRLSSDGYSIENELKKYKSQKSFGRKKKHGKQDDELNLEGNLVFINANHFFVNQIPDQLSTYEALNSFVQSINEENDFKNPVVEKLLANALTEERIEIKKENIDNEIQNVIDTYIPLSLSNSQIQGIKNAWADEISYIQGPPGTGKSHTISAIVLSAIALNKKVLVISQKIAALEVVNKKIEPLLSDGDGLTGICYYDKTARQTLKNYCDYLKKAKTSNTSSFKRNITITQNSLAESEKDLKNKLKEVASKRQELDKILDNQRRHKEVHETFLKELKRIKDDFTEIPEGFSFKRIKDKNNYRVAIERVENLLGQNANTLSSKLYIHKFKEHLKTKFNAQMEWLEGYTFPYFCEAFIELNILFTEAQDIERRLNIDANSIRKKIKNLTQDITAIQKQLIKLKYKSHVLGSLNNTNYEDEIDKFRSMLHNTNSRLIDKRMKEVDFYKITDIIPFWTAEIRNLGHLFPLTADLFDLVVVDEASQVNLAEILPAFYRGKKICIVGDHNQLSLKASGLNFSLSKSFDELTWEKYRPYIRYQTGTKKKLTVTQASILDFIRNEEYQVTIKEEMLDEHFRSLPHLARYTSKQFYRDNENPVGKLKIMTETPDKMATNCFQAVRVDGKRTRNEKGDSIGKTINAEAEEVVRIIEDLVTTNNQIPFPSKYSLPSHINKNNFTIGVISLIRDQCTIIEDLLRKRFPNQELKPFGINVDEKTERDGIGTPEEFQGNERDIMIFSLSLDLGCSKGQGFYQDAKRLNVATSRAKLFTYFVYSPFPETFNKIHDYLNYFNGKVTDEDIASGDTILHNPELPPLNFNKFESDFERYVYSYLEKFVKEKSKGQKITLHNQIISCGQKRLDFVIFNHDTKKSVAVEVDGSYHFVSNRIAENYTFEHIERMNILTRAGWNIINTPYYKWYKNGWLSEENDPNFKNEIDRIYSEISAYIF